jgi:hypothetical protein
MVGSGAVGHLPTTQALTLLRRVVPGIAAPVLRGSGRQDLFDPPIGQVQGVSDSRRYDTTRMELQHLPLEV